MSTQHARTAIATGTCLTFGLAAAVAVGAVPQVSSAEDPARAVPGIVQPELARLMLDPSNTQSANAAAPARRVMYTTHPRIEVASTTLSRDVKTVPAHKRHRAAPVEVAPAPASGPSAEAAHIKHAPATHHKKKHHKKKHHRHHHHKKAHQPTKPVLAARTTPSAAAVSKAIAGLRSFVRTPLTPTSAQVAQFGDAVCSAFDDGKTFSQVKAEILAQVKKLPFTTVTAGAADYVVTTAVSLYCPGYKSKVS